MHQVRVQVNGEASGIVVVRVRMPGKLEGAWLEREVPRYLGTYVGACLGGRGEPGEWMSGCLAVFWASTCV